MRPAVCTVQDAHLQGEVCFCQARSHSMQRLPQSLILPSAWQRPSCTWNQSRAPSQQADGTCRPGTSSGCLVAGSLVKVHCSGAACTP